MRICLAREKKSRETVALTPFFVIYVVSCRHKLFNVPYALYFSSYLIWIQNKHCGFEYRILLITTRVSDSDLFFLIGKFFTGSSPTHALCKVLKTSTKLKIVLLQIFRKTSNFSGETGTDKHKKVSE